MSLLRIEKIGENAFWALWEVQETLEDLKHSLNLSEAEEEELNNIHNVKKKIEWLSARNALQKICQFNGNSHRGIFKDQHGKPYLNQIHHISLAHSFPYAAAIYHECVPTGIDIEKIQPKLLKVATKYLNHAELEAAGQDLEALCVLWVAKESLFKLYGRKKISLKENIAINPFVCNSEGVIEGTIRDASFFQKYSLKYLRMGDYYICFNIS